MLFNFKDKDIGEISSSIEVTKFAFDRQKKGGNL